MTTIPNPLPGVYATTLIHHAVLAAGSHPLLDQATAALGADADLVVVAVPAGSGAEMREAITEHLAMSVEHNPDCPHAGTVA
jgi:prephenate dehydrogenase